ncbi:hypothetical protein ABZ352_35505 [Streptomyces griseofuscus]|uniref:hypothetical protein n=1 Tax=Streptomyces griseofuscus TaxID=146922 RepID=UPI0033DD89B9
MHSRGGTCPRCKGYTGFSVRGGDDPKLYQHRTPEPFRSRCPAGGITWSEARAGWTSLTLRTYRWLLINKPDEAPAYRDRHVKDTEAQL